MIVIEGPDGAGKSTLIEKLSRELDIPVAPRVVSKDAEAMVDLQAWVHDNLEAGWQNTIFDRHRLISEPIYGPALRSDPQPGFDDPLWFYEELTRFYLINPLVVYCLPPREVCWLNVLKGDDNRIFHGNPQGFNQIYGAYFNKAFTDRALRPSTWVWDYTKNYSKQKYLLLRNTVREQCAYRSRA